MLRTLSLAAALVALVGVCLPARAALSPVKLRVAGKDVALKSPAVYDGKEVYLPLESVTALGGKYRLTAREETALVTYPNGETAEVAVARPGGKPMLPLSVLAKRLHVETRVEKGICTVGPPGDPPPAPRPAATHVISASQGSKDHNGSAGRKESTGQMVIVVNHGPTQSPDSVDSQDSPQQPKPKDGQTPKAPDKQAAPEPEHDTTLVLPLPPSDNGAQPAQPAPGTGAAQGLVPIRDISFEPLDDSHAQIRIKSDGRINGYAKSLADPSKLAIDIPSASLETGTNDWSVDHPFLNGIHAGPGEKPGVTRITLDLQKLIGYRIIQTGTTGLQVNLNLPRGVGRPMKELIVVVDPGHGGKSTGCHANVGGHIVYEKSMTMVIGEKLRQCLADAGVKVLMTRTDDTFVDLPARPGLATQNNADLFVSIHIDDCGIANSASGSTAYYHMSDSSSRALAQSIIANVRRVSGLPSRGALSDGVLYQSGLSVLRNATVPAVLVEVGYFNNARDRAKIMTGDFQQAVAQAICEGIRGYVEGALPDVARGQVNDTSVMHLTDSK